MAKSFDDISFLATVFMTIGVNEHLEEVVPSKG